MKFILKLGLESIEYDSMHMKGLSDSKILGYLSPAEFRNKKPKELEAVDLAI